VGGWVGGWVAEWMCVGGWMVLDIRDLNPDVALFANDSSMNVSVCAHTQTRARTFTDTNKYTCTFTYTCTYTYIYTNVLFEYQRCSRC